MKKKKLLIAPIFIPHEGCPYRCVFCNQVDITGQSFKADEQKVLDVIKTYLEPSFKSKNYARREIAFYGGSFTGLPAERQRFLLSLVQPLIKNRLIDAIRVSTHPLFIDKKKIIRLTNYGVKTIELGIQSTSQEVLEESGRPCSMEDILGAVSLISKMKFTLGLQLMVGLPGDNEKRFAASVSDVIRMKPHFVRLYPALVLRHTSLHSMYKKGLYTPWSLERTVDVLKSAVKSFENKGIPIIRVGLQPDSSLYNNLIDGPFHPSLRYLVDCKIGLDMMIEKILSLSSMPKKVLFRVPQNYISIYTGNRRDNLRFLKKEFGLDEVSIKGEETCSQLELMA